MKTLDTEVDKKEVEPIDEIQEKEVYRYTKLLKSDKSPGPDGITNEALKLGLPTLLPYMTELFNLIFKTGSIPKQWCTSDIILLYKKGDPLGVTNYRPISLLPCLYKLFMTILTKRITRPIEVSQPVEQAGFRSGFSTTDHIHTLELIIEKYQEYNRPLYIAFIDYSKAFDSISHKSIWKALKTFHVNQGYINLLRTIYSKSVSRVRLEKRGEEINIGRGVRQGDPISPKLFIAVLENIFQKINWKNCGLKIGDRYLSHLRFADDIAVLSESPKQLEKMICTLDKESSKVGLEMNSKKTKVMTNSHRKPITVSGGELEYVNTYIYLGKQISFNKNKNDEEIERRVNITWKKYWSQKEVLKGNYCLNMKKIIMDTTLLPCLLYGSQTWIYTNKAKLKIRSCQRAMERSLLGLKKIHKIRSETIRNKTKVTDALNHALKLKWNWAGHVSRLTDKRWTLLITKWKGPPGKRKVGRPIKRWADDIAQTVGKKLDGCGKRQKGVGKIGGGLYPSGIHIIIK